MADELVDRTRDLGITRGRPAGDTMSGAALLVVAIDFGTTYSGYAYSFSSDFERNPQTIYGQNLISEFTTGRQQHDKVPTSVLFNPQRQFVAFGFDAQNQYAALGEDSTQNAVQWFYFERFKMHLHSNTSLSRDMPLKDVTRNKSMPAIDVFAACIGFLKKHLQQTLREKRTMVEEKDISWVLTVPAIWDEQARQFMREAAAKGGIPEHQLCLALEPEAASVYCHYLTQSRDPSLQSGGCQLEHLMEVGKKFTVVDCGGGTIDLTVYEVMQGGNLRTLKELHPPSGGPYGGIKVDEAFKTFLTDLVGFDVERALESLLRARNRTSEKTETKEIVMLQLYRELEQAKRLLNTGSAKLALKLPDSIVEVFVTNNVHQKIRETDGKVSIVRNRLTMESDTVRKLFEKPVEAILASIDSLLHQQTTRGVGTIILVGGFSESVIIQEAVREKFANYTVIVPPNPAAVVLKGAVQFRHNPSVIGWRASAFTYGVRSSADFKNGVHDPSKKRVIHGQAVCMDIFNAFIRTNDVVKVNDLVQMQTFSPLYNGQAVCTLKIFKSRNRDVKYTTDEGCEEVGQLDLHLGDTSRGRDGVIVVTAMVGGTELKFFAVEAATLKVCSVTHTFLDK